MNYNLRPRPLNRRRRVLTERQVQLMNIFGKLGRKIVKRGHPVASIAKSTRKYLVRSIQKQIKFRHRRFVTLSHHVPRRVFANLVFKHVDEEDFKVNWMRAHKTEKGKWVPERTRLSLEVDVLKCIDIFGSKTANEKQIIDQANRPYYGCVVLLDHNDRSTMKMKYCYETEQLQLKFQFQLYRKIGKQMILI